MVIRMRTIINTVILIIFGVFAGLLIREISVSEVFFQKGGFCVVLDAGHGEPDSGAVGNSGTLEKDINLSIVKKLGEVLESSGISVIYTREGDSGIYDEEADTIRKMKVSDMKKRREIIKNSGADLFVTIHMNAFSDENVNGINVFYDSAHEEIKPFAEAVLNQLCNITRAKPQNVKAADEKLYLMKNSQIPAMLVECGFISNPEEEKLLNQEEYQAKIAWAIAKEIIVYAYK